MDAHATSSGRADRAETNGHAEAVTAPPRARHVLVPVAFWTSGLVALLMLTHAGIPLWARAARPLADDAVAFVAIGAMTLMVIFLPVFAASWRTARVNSLATVVWVGFAGAVQGASLTAVAGTQARLLLLIGAISTIWICTACRPALRRFAWCGLLIWAIGFPTAGYLAADFDGEQGLASTLLHLSPARLLQ